MIQVHLATSCVEVWICVSNVSVKEERGMYRREMNPVNLLLLTGFGRPASEVKPPPPFLSPKNIYQNNVNKEGQNREIYKHNTCKERGIKETHACV